MNENTNQSTLAKWANSTIVTAIAGLAIGIVLEQTQILPVLFRKFVPKKATE